MTTRKVPTAEDRLQAIRIALAGIRERYLPECTAHTKAQHQHGKYALRAAAIGSLATTVKNVFKSNATARNVFGRDRPATNSR